MPPAKPPKARVRWSIARWLQPNSSFIGPHSDCSLGTQQLTLPPNGNLGSIGNNDCPLRLSSPYPWLVLSISPKPAKNLLAPLTYVSGSYPQIDRRLPT